MDGVIIIDEKQMVIQNVSGIMTSWSGDKFTIRFDTVRNEFHDGLTDEELLDRIIDGSSPVVAANQESEAATPVVQSTTPVTRSDVHLAFQPSSAPATVNTLSTASTRMVIEPPKVSTGRATFGSAITGDLREKQQHQRAAVPDAPSSHGIILPEKNSTLVGESFQMAIDHVHILNKTRRDFSVQLIHESDTSKFKNLKANVVLKSDQFFSMDENSIRLALHTLVTAEQGITRGLDRENMLYLDVKPVLVVEGITDEKEGTGVFHFEETTSVYENPTTYRTKVDNGKD